MRLQVRNIELNFLCSLFAVPAGPGLLPRSFEGDATLLIRESLSTLNCLSDIFQFGFSHAAGDF